MVNDYGSLEFQTVELMNQDIPNLPTGKLKGLAYIAISHTVENTFM